MKEARSYRTKQREMVLQFFSAHPGKCLCQRTDRTKKHTGWIRNLIANPCATVSGKEN